MAKLFIFNSLYKFVIYYFKTLSNNYLKNRNCIIILTGGLSIKKYFDEYETYDFDIKIFPKTDDDEIKNIGVAAIAIKYFLNIFF